MKRQNNCYVLVGDFNARLLREEGLNPRNFGKHFLKTKREMNEINQDVLNNRERCIDFVQENDLIVKNTMFNKRMKNRCTYKNKNTGHKGGKPWNATNYGQIDYIMIENRWKNAIYEAWSAPFTGIESDHFPVIGRIKIKLAKKEKMDKKEGDKKIRPLENNGRTARKNQRHE